MNGIIKKLTRDREYGFIRAEDGVDYFFDSRDVHGPQAHPPLKEGLVVTFQPRFAPRGPRAGDIALAA
jgi:cold shock CspA family protein